MIKEQVKNKTSNLEATIRGCLYSSYNDDQKKIITKTRDENEMNMYM